MKPSNDRRTFFKKAGIGAIGASLLSIIPMKLFSRTPSPMHREDQSSIAIKINPLAVKREKKK